MKWNIVGYLGILLCVVHCFGPFRQASCSLYGNCGRKSIFGSELPCPAASDNKNEPISEDSRKLLVQLCGDEWKDIKELCCTDAQISDLRTYLRKAENIIASCPACDKNFKSLFCHFTCSPQQSEFVNVTETDTSLDGREVVSELSFFVSNEWSQTFYNSCKDVKFAATNGYAMDLIGGGAKNDRQFLKFLGDKKPLLGGSPFQINFNYSHNSSSSVLNTPVYGCADNCYRCACADCPGSCPELKPIGKDHCQILGIPCFSAAVLSAYFALFFFIVGWHIDIIRKKKQPILLESDLDIEDTSTDQLFQDISIEQYYFTQRLQFGIAGLCRHCLEYSKTVIFTSVLIVVLLSIAGVVFGELERDPINLWVSKNSKSYKEKAYFDDKFGPFYRVEQIFVVNETGPVLSYDTLKWWFDLEKNITTDLKSQGEISYNDLCFRPTEDSSCVIESLTQYFAGDLPSESDWRQQLQGCTSSPVNCLPPFQQPLKPNLLFSSDAVFDSHSFVTTLLLDNHTSSSTEWERQLEAFLLNVDVPTGLRISFSTEMSLEKELNKNNDVSIVCLSYFMMFLYASWALRNNAGKSRFILGAAGIIVVLGSVAASAGILSLLGLKSTLIIAEVIPFLILAIGIDNIYLITHEYDRISKKSDDMSLDEKILEAVITVCPSIIMALLCQLSCFVVSSLVPMPAVRNFAIYSAVSVVVNVVLQLLVYTAVLKVYEQNSRQKFVLSEDVSSKSRKLLDFYHQLVRRKRRIMAIFVTWTLLSLPILPFVSVGLDQKLAIPETSYLIDYFNDVYEYLNVGPPVYFVMKGLDYSKRGDQKKICGKFTACDSFSFANVLEQERSRSTVTEPITNWLDDFFMFLNPQLDNCCRLKKANDDVCPPSFPPRRCRTCYDEGEWNYDMTGFPEGDNFTKFFDIWIDSPSDPCPLGGKAPYSKAIARNGSFIDASTFRSAHEPLRSQTAFIRAFKDSERIIKSFKNLDVFAYSPFYIFFAQYASLVPLAIKLLILSTVAIFAFSWLILGVLKTALLLTISVLMILVDIGGLFVFAGISFNAVTLVNLIICAGLAVEFCVHMARAFTFIPPTIKNDKGSRMNHAIETAGGSILTGVTLTKLIGVGVLAFTQSKIFQVFYFRLWLMLIIVSCLHALLFLPIILSLYGGESFVCNEFDTET
ncbi:LAMI_0F12794g1_1 [Lachancea mirantina]|uniref:LAMI_0F12794g1_1 n=1 Tax=Lachancea mirantina TaxID=1230905 RepID=A0A1G4K325_9SACH|nr:LAMI_0F12794g1_1 [Lachancea mirantina]